jgi:tetrahydromethanopterin S-methyltransferase subunit F
MLVIMIFFLFGKEVDALRAESMAAHGQQARRILVSKDMVAIRAQSLVFDVHVKNILILRNVQLYIGIEHKKNVNIII